MKLFSSILFFILTISCSFAQEQKDTSTEVTGFESAEDSLIVLAKVFLNDKSEENRVSAAAKFKPFLKETLQKQDAFNYKFDSLLQVSIQYPEDSTFRIFTWQLFINDNEYQYSGFLQRADNPGQIVDLIDKSAEIEDPDYDFLSAENWYGALYYNIHQYDTKQGRQYLLFGFDAYTFFNKRKLVDVLTFKNDQLVFGAPVFAKQREGAEPIVLRHRFLLEYSAEVSIRLNYDKSLKHIIFDHLKFKRGSYGQGDTLVGDGSYEGFFLKKGLWIHVAKMFNHVSEEPPRPHPVLDNRKKKDIFGRNDKGQ